MSRCPVNFTPVIKIYMNQTVNKDSNYANENYDLIVKLNTDTHFHVGNFDLFKLGFSKSVEWRILSKGILNSTDTVCNICTLVTIYREDFCVRDCTSIMGVARIFFGGGNTFSKNFQKFSKNFVKNFVKIFKKFAKKIFKNIQKKFKNFF